MRHILKRRNGKVPPYSISFPLGQRFQPVYKSGGNFRHRPSRRSLCTSDQSSSWSGVLPGGTVSTKGSSYPQVQRSGPTRDRPIGTTHTMDSPSAVSAFCG